MLSARRRVFAVDLKGFGASPKPDDGAYGLHDHAEAVLGFIERRDLRDVALVGHSFGGGVALVVALELQRRDAARVGRLVLIDGLGWPQRPPPELLVLRTRLLGDLLVSSMPTRWLVRIALLLSYYDPRKIEEAFVDAYAAPLRRRDARRALRQTVQQTLPDHLEDLIPRYRGIAAPVTLLWGREDRVVPLASAERLKAAIPGARLIVLDRCGHIPQEECAEATFRVLREVL